jgi:hypothetical protein
MKRFSAAVWVAVFYAVLVFAQPAAAQVVIAPQSAVFVHSDADFAITANYHFDFYTCASVTAAGVCVGQASAPVQLGLDVLKAAVSSSGQSRTISLVTPPAPTLLGSVPIGTGIVATVVAVGDPNVVGVGGQSAPSTASNAFFFKPRTPAAPGTPVVKP